MIDSVPRSLYIHVPFCARRCSYCDFAVEARRDPPTELWLEAIGAELELLARDEGWLDPLDLDTLYIGGGTPSLLGPEAMHRLLERISPFCRLSHGAEWTCEANPESFTPEVARGWREAGVNRISLGLQTFNASALTWMGRLHDAAGIVSAVEAARSAAFEDVSLDLIFALPSRLQRDWNADLQQVLELDPQHISLYGLTAEPGTPLGRWVEGGREVMADEDRYAEEYLLAHEILTANGYEHYEVSNFARPGRTSRHNQTYWTGAPYAALGPGAHSYSPPHRRWNVRSWEAYREALGAGRLPCQSSEELGEEELELERIWLGLRCRTGYELRNLTSPQLRLLEGWAEEGLADLERDRVRLTARGWLLLDRISIELHLAGGRSAPVRNIAIDAAAPLVQIAANSNLCGNERATTD